jgi:CHASE2 domain-containing sensor protein
MQDWRSLAWALASAVLAGGLAWLLAEHAMQASGAFVRAVFGGSVLLLVYALLNLKRR